MGLWYIARHVWSVRFILRNLTIFVIPSFILLYAKCNWTLTLIIVPHGTFGSARRFIFGGFIHITNRYTMICRIYPCFKLAYHIHPLIPPFIHPYIQSFIALSIIMYKYMVILLYLLANKKIMILGTCLFRAIRRRVCHHTSHKYRRRNLTRSSIALLIWDVLILGWVWYVTTAIFLFT